MYKLVQNFVPSSKYGTKCPYAMTPTAICVHNTANDASARNEVSYMINNNNQVSYHVAIDDIEAVEAIPFNRNAWHAGDGNGRGNRNTIGIEICYSKSGGSRFTKAEKNAAIYIAEVLKQYGWGIDKVTKHQDYSGKYCPHRTLDMGWSRFINMVKAELNGTSEEKPSTPSKTDSLYRVQTGAFKKKANADELVSKLKKKGFDTYMVQDDGLYKVQVGAYSKKANADAQMKKLKDAGFDAFITTNGGTASTTAPKKTVDQIADEVIAGKWGNGDDREKRLKAAGYNYQAVQDKVNAKLGSGSKKTVTQIAKEVIAGKWGNGADREKRLKAAGYNYKSVQDEVNRLLK